MKESKELEWPEIKQSYWYQAEDDDACWKREDVYDDDVFNFLFFKKNPAAILLRLQLLKDRIHLYKWINSWTG